jgi:hypothetical protein
MVTGGFKLAGAGGAFGLGLVAVALQHELAARQISISARTNETSGFDI